MVSETGHYTSFVKPAKEYMLVVEARFQELLKGRSRIIAKLEPRPDRMY